MTIYKSKTKVLRCRIKKYIVAKNLKFNIKLEK